MSRDLYQGVIGIDRTFFTNIYVNLQFFTDLIEDGQESLASKRKTHGLTFEISDNWQITPGYMFFNGPKNSRLGQYGENDMVYLRLKYSF